MSKSRCGIDVPQNELGEHIRACPFDSEIEHCKYYRCTATFVRKDVQKNHERQELLNHCKLMLQLPDDLNDLAAAIRNGERNDAADRIVLSRIIVTLKGHLVLLLLLVILILGTYCILNGWGKHFYESFYSTKIGIEGGQYSDRELNVAPVIIKMPGFKQKLWKDKEWVSRSFYAFHEGYLVFLKVYAAGIGDEVESMSVFLVLMKGPYDDRLQELGYWPMCGKFKVKLLNQFDSHDHYTKELMSNYDCVDRVTDNYVSNTAWGRSDFISHYQLLYGKNKFLKNDTLYFEVTYKDTPMLDLFLISIVIVSVLVFCYICKLHAVAS